MIVVTGRQKCGDRNEGKEKRPAEVYIREGWFMVIVIILVVVLLIVLISTLYNRSLKNMRILTVRIPITADRQETLGTMLETYTRSAKLVGKKDINDSNVCELEYEIELKNGDIPTDIISSLLDSGTILSISCRRPHDDDIG